MGLFSKIGDFVGDNVLGLGSSVLGFGADIGKTVLGHYWDKKATKKAYNRELELWNMTNAYNSPIQQMERLRTAGLNPNLVYGGGSATHTATMASAPRQSGTRMSNAQLDILGSLSAYQGLENMHEQNENLRAQRSKIYVDAEVAARQADILKQEQRIKQREADLFERWGDKSSIRNLVSFGEAIVRGVTDHFLYR